MKKVADIEVPTKVNESVDIQSLLFSKASRCLVANSIPTVYEGDGVSGIVFDENARKLPTAALENGLILDISAAEILSGRGIDVGLKKINGPLSDISGSIIAGIEERFLHNDNYISIIGASIYDIAIKEGAEVLSDIGINGRRIPISYRYENADGNRFFVLNVNSRTDKSSMLKHYARGRQIAESIEWLSGKKLPAYAYGHPSLYIQCKQNELSMSVGLWNFFADTAIDPVIELGEEYSSIKFINCDGRLEKDKIYLSDINPFTFAGLEVFK